MNNERVSPLDEMRQGREASSAAFMEFISKRKFHKDYAFCFYEGEDGKYYDWRIEGIIGDNFFHIKAGNKNKVLQVMKLIKNKPEYQNVNTMFFVDRDMGFDMEEYKEKDVYVTPCYSIENLYVNKESFGRILKTEFGLNIDDADYNTYKQKFIEMYHSFCDLMLEFNALILIRKEKELDCEKVNIQKIKTTDLVNIDIIDGLSKNTKYDSIINSLKEKLSITDEDIELAQIRLLEYGEKPNIFRGKNQFDFMESFIYQLCEKKNTIFENKLSCIFLSKNKNRLSTFSSYAHTPECLISFLEAHKLKEMILC